MPNQTPNYNLTKPLQTENYNVDIFNANSDIIDTTLKKIDNQSNGSAKYTDAGYFCGAFTRDMSLTSDYTVGGVGFKPRAVFFNAVQDQTPNFSNGYDTLSTKFCTFSNFSGKWGSNNALSLNLVTNTGEGIGSKVKEFTQDGFTLMFEKANNPTGTMAVSFIAFR